MINTKYLLLASACVLLSSSSQASEAENLTFSYSGSPLVNIQTYTTHTPMELEPISHFNSDNAVKLAAVCAVGGGKCNGLGFGFSGNSINLDEASQCTDEGYIKSCPEGQVPDDNNLCPHNKSYFKCRPCNNSCNSRYSLTACNSTTQVQTASYKTECGSTCYQCRDKTCEDGGYKSNVPTNNVCSDVTYYGRTCKTDCYQPTCDYNNSGYKSGVPTNYVCSQVSYYGRTCYKDCYQPQCAAGGYLDACPANQSGTSVTYYGRNCIKDCKEAEIACEIGSVLYEDKKCHSSTDKTPIAVVFDTNKRLAISLNQPLITSSYTSWGIWGGEETDITNLENCDFFNIESCGTDGKANTAAIITFGRPDNVYFPSAYYCYEYTTPGTKVGDWFLPSQVELKSIYNAKSTINATLRMMEPISGIRPSLVEGHYWSSTEAGEASALGLDMQNGTDFIGKKSASSFTRPIIQY